MKLRTHSWQIYGLVPLSKLSKPEKYVPMSRSDKIGLSLVIFSITYFVIRGFF